jgi:hypothetical protein
MVALKTLSGNVVYLQILFISIPSQEAVLDIILVSPILGKWSCKQKSLSFIHYFYYLLLCLKIENILFSYKKSTQISGKCTQIGLHGLSFSHVWAIWEEMNPPYPPHHSIEKNKHKYLFRDEQSFWKDREPYIFNKEKSNFLVSMGLK